MNRVFQAGHYQLLLGKKNYVMGILDLVPNKFDTEELGLSTDAAVAQAWDMAAVGAAGISINGQPEQPECPAISAQAELDRLLPVLDALISDKFSIPIAVETQYPSVAYECMKHGVDIINDRNGFSSPDMIEAVAASHTCGCIVIHKGGAQDGDILNTIRQFFERQIQVLNASGIQTERICLSPGVGHGKTYEENLQILANADKISTGGCGMLMMASHKRVISAASGNAPSNQGTAPGTIAADSIAQFCGIDIVCAHDVPEAVQAARVTQEIHRCRKIDGTMKI